MGIAIANRKNRCDLGALRSGVARKSRNEKQKMSRIAVKQHCGKSIQNCHPNGILSKLTLSFLPWFFFFSKKKAMKTTKKQGLFSARNPWYLWIRGKNAQKNKEFLAGEKNKGKKRHSPKKKERKDRVERLSNRTTRIARFWIARVARFRIADSVPSKVWCAGSACQQQGRSLGEAQHCPGLHLATCTTGTAGVAPGGGGYMRETGTICVKWSF